MTQTIELPLWLFVIIVLFAAITALSHFLLPSVRWFVRRRLQRAVARLNERLAVPIEPFRLLRRQDMIQRLIYDPQVTEAIVAHARAEEVREDVAFQQARRYAREIVPSFSAFAYFGLGIRIARWFANLVYDVRTEELNAEVLKAIPSDATVIFVMNHRSNMDYVLVTYLAAQASALSYAVGEWARVWPLSRLIKSMGAYFIRRKSRGQLYRKVLARYVQMATAGGVTQAVFPEGGLSLNGKLAPPKMGILAYIAEANVAREVMFVPVAINYDRVLEDRVLVAAGEAGTRRFRASLRVATKFILHQLWLRLRGRYLRFGEAAVRFGTPVPLSEYGPTPDVEVLAHDLMHRVAAEMPRSLVPMIAHLLLSADEPMTAAALKRALEPTGRSDTSIQAACDHLLQRHFIQEDQAGYRIVPEQRPLLTYYANSVRHIFADAEEISAPAKS